MQRVHGNLLVLQSGGPTQVINQSLAGVARTALAAGYSRVLGAAYGINGLLNESFVELGRVAARDWSRIAATPGAALGASRYKLMALDVERTLATLKRQAIGTLISIGGNDSAENAHQLHLAARQVQWPLQVVAVPKTIDNDLPETDHCPGYGSAARFLALALMGISRDTETLKLDRPTAIVEVAGRNAGWLAAASALGKREERDGPHLICPPEQPIDEEQVLERLDTALTRWGIAVAVVSETGHGANGPLGQAEAPEYVDAFGHAYYSSPAQYLARLATQRLGHPVRCIRPDSIQRSFAAATSRVDAREAALVGQAAVEAARNGASDVMVALRRELGRPYRCGTALVPLASVAGKERKLPNNYFNWEESLPTPAFRDYALPLLGPLPRFSRL